MIGKRHELARLQSDFYRHYYYKMLRVNFLSFGIILLLIVAIIYLVLQPKPPKYYVSTVDGQLFQWCMGKNRFVRLQDAVQDGSC